MNIKLSYVQIYKVKDEFKIYSMYPRISQISLSQYPLQAPEGTIVLLEDRNNKSNFM